MSDLHLIAITVNGEAHEVAVDSRRTLADVLRHDLRLTGTHLGCEHGVCGACTVLLDGSPVRSCLVFGVQADGMEVETVEGLADDGTLGPLQQAFSEEGGLQCGFCTPGFLMLGTALLREHPDPTEEEIDDLVAANLCRCTGYAGIRRALLKAARGGATEGWPEPARVEDPRLLTGGGRFVDDVDRAGQLWMRVVRADLAAAEIVEIDAEAARQMEGVVAVLDATSLPDGFVIPIRLGPYEGDLTPFLQPVLAGAEVRYVGEPVAVVVAEDPYVAEDAAERVVTRYAPREPLLDSAQHGAEPAVTLRRGFGDADAAFAAADLVVEVDVRVGRHSAVPLETRGLVADWDTQARHLTVWGATKVPHFNRGALARLLGLGAEEITIRASDAGGGFGVRGELYPEDVLVTWLAMRFERPVKWIEDRSEHLVATNHSREQSRRLEGAFREDGSLLAVRDRVRHDNGAYLRTHGLLVPEMTLGMLLGPYRVDGYDGEAQVFLTNKTPAGTYRAPGRYEATFARERLLDKAAAALGMDPIALRRRNLLKARELPHHRPVPVLGHEVVIDDADFAGLLAETLKESNWSGWKKEAAKLRGEGRAIGVGFAYFLEKSGGGGFETARIDVLADGRLRVSSGATSLGQGVETVLAEVVCRELDVARADVAVVAGDTDLVEAGGGSWASRSTVYAGSAAQKAAQELRALLLEVASELLEADARDLELGAGAVEVRGSPSSRISFAELAARSDALANGRHGRPPGLSVTATFTDAPMTYPYGVHLAQVEVDRRSGAVSVLRYHVGYDVGTAISPRQVEGQLVGGAAQGIGGALLEEFTYDELGQPQSTTFIDYLLPTAAEVPDVTLTLLERGRAKGNPLGAKGAGEGGTTACGAAIAAAVDDALQRPGAILELPITPTRVMRLLAGEE
ncbi:MAG: molybdopterin-dependent oxidoreductase [Actinobacteria bacterium]|nr:molybdopterin-dependent oxidoreductase [Actinomycetota bacterium]